MKLHGLAQDTRVSTLESDVVEAPVINTPMKEPSFCTKNNTAAAGEEEGQILQSLSWLREQSRPLGGVFPGRRSIL